MSRKIPGIHNNRSRKFSQPRALSVIYLLLVLPTIIVIIFKYNSSIAFSNTGSLFSRNIIQDDVDGSFVDNYRTFLSNHSGEEFKDFDDFSSKFSKKGEDPVVASFLIVVLILESELCVQKKVNQSEQVSQRLKKLIYSIRDSNYQNKQINLAAYIFPSFQSTGCFDEHFQHATYDFIKTFKWPNGHFNIHFRDVGSSVEQGFGIKYSPS